MVLDSQARATARPDSDTLWGLDSVTTIAQLFSRIRKMPGVSSASLSNHIAIAERVNSQVDRQDRNISEYMVEVHKKYSVSFACLIFILIGTPLGIMARRGGIFVGISYGLFFFVLYWIFLIQGESLADNLIISPVVAMWSCNVIIGMFGLYLILQMVREEPIIDFSFIQQWKSLLFRRTKNNHLQKQSIRQPLWHFIGSFLTNAPFGIIPAYLVRIFLNWLVVLFIVLIIIFDVLDYFSYLRRFEGATFFDIVLFYLYYNTWFVSIIFPIAILLAAMFSMSLLAKNNELTAIKAAGISVRRLILPLLCVGVCLSALNFYLSEKVLPIANAKRLELMEDINSGKRHNRVRNSDPGFGEILTDFFYFSDKNIAYRMSQFLPKSQRAEGIERVIFSSGAIVQHIKAESMLFDSTQRRWTLYNGEIKNFSKKAITHTHFAEMKDSLLFAPPAEMTVRIKGIDQLSYWELKDRIDKANRRGEKTSVFKADLYFKLALPCLNFIVMLMGLSITAITSRSGGTLNIGLGLFLTLAYWVLSQFTISLGKNGTLDPLVAAWICNILFLCIGLTFFRKASQ
ncbi:MAG: LptF/LptG family permease, partial [Chitinivibrionales bacterium]|nr:LptF/LptG family permease [Chitinivibrionales bacterium]